MGFIKAVVQFFMVVFGVVTLVFLVLRLTPGDPIETILGEQPQNIAPDMRKRLESDLGLDLPAHQQLLSYYAKLAHLDLGYSFTQKKPVKTLIGDALPSTLFLALSASFLANIFGLFIGAVAALAQKRALSRFLIFYSSFFQSLPTFWVGPLLIIAFALHWPGLPVSGFDEPLGLVLPSITLALGMSGLLARACQEAFEQCLKSDYIRTARAKGLPEWVVVLKHILPNALPPLVVISSLQLGHLLAGALVTETVFDWPGIGSLMYDAVSQRDYPMIQGIVIVVATSYVFINTLADRVAARFSIQGSL